MKDEVISNFPDMIYLKYRGMHKVLERIFLLAVKLSIKSCWMCTKFHNFECLTLSLKCFVNYFYTPKKPFILAQQLWSCNRLDQLLPNLYFPSLFDISVSPFLTFVCFNENWGKTNPGLPKKEGSEHCLVWRRYNMTSVNHLIPPYFFSIVSVLAFTVL